MCFQSTFCFWLLPSHSVCRLHDADPLQLMLPPFLSGNPNLKRDPRYEDKKPDAGADGGSPPASSSGGAGSEFDDLAARFMNLRK